MKDDKIKFAIVHSWDIKLASGEKEAALRFSIAAQAMGIECIHINQNGYAYNKDYELTGQHISTISNVLFVIYTHYSVCKCCDIWSIFPLWNPPTIPFNWPSPKNYLRWMSYYDDYAVSTSPLTVAHINTLLQKQGRSFDGKQVLMPSLSKTQILAPKIQGYPNLRIFYCGMSWERSANVPLRHSIFLRKLDQLDFVDYYGPSHIGDTPTWEGYKNYRGEIPFDGGKSLLPAINRSGISLAISSLEHSRSLVMSNRLFESLAAGAFVITDRNEFTEKNFKDTAWLVDNTGDQEILFKQVIDAYKWVESHPEEANEKAKAAQNTFVENFSLESMLQKIIEDLPDRKKLLSKQIHALSEDYIDVVAIWASDSLEDIDEFIGSINRQSYNKLRIIFMCDIKLGKAAEKILQKYCSEYDIVVSAVDLYNWNAPKTDISTRKMTTSQLLLKSFSLLKSNYVSFYYDGDIWYTNHMATLKRRLDDNKDAWVSYSALIMRYLEFNKETHSVDITDHPFTISKLYSSIRNNETLGTVLARKSYIDILLDSDFSVFANFIDFFDFYIFMHLAIAKEKADYSHNLTMHKNHYLQSTEVRGHFSRISKFELLIFPYTTQISMIKSHLYDKYSNLIVQSTEENHCQLNFEPQLNQFAKRIEYCEHNLYRVACFMTVARKVKAKTIKLKSKILSLYKSIHFNFKR